MTPMALTLQPRSAALRAAAGGCARYPRGSYAAGEPHPPRVVHHARGRYCLEAWRAFDG
jgi:hypothetical protein